MEEARRKGDWARMSELQYGKLPQLEAQLKKADKAQGTAARPKLLRTEVGAEEIAEVVSRATGIPVSKMMQGEREKLLHMEEKLHERVVGQDEAVRLVADAIRRSRAGLSDPNRPYGSFLFLGPTGVGKTELCKALADFLFDSEDHLIRIDMSEFMEKHSVARLIGAPPGYVGYEEGGHLTEVVRRKPYSVILLDEVEKAHPDVFNVLLQVLDDGRMTDGQGRTVDFKNTVIVMTSNLGSQMIQQMAGSDYEVVKLAVMGEVKANFRPEFVNRIDEIVVFHALDEEHISDIARIQLRYLTERLAKLEMGLEVSDAALAELAKAGFDPVYGARPLKRAIQQSIENPLAKEILEGTLRRQGHDRVDFGKAGIVFEKAAPEGEEGGLTAAMRRSPEARQRGRPRPPFDGPACAGDYPAWLSAIGARVPVAPSIVSPVDDDRRVDGVARRVPVHSDGLRVHHDRPRCVVDGRARGSRAAARSAPARASSRRSARSSPARSSRASWPRCPRRRPRPACRPRWRRRGRPARGRWRRRWCRPAGRPGPGRRRWRRWEPVRRSWRWRWRRSRRVSSASSSPGSC